MVRESYQEQLRRLSCDVFSMGNKVAGRLNLGLQALEHPDKELVRRLEEGDEEIDELYLKIERDCIDLLALQQPVAADLRLITASFKIITDLERIADLALNLGQYALKYSARYALLPLDELLAVGQLSVEMLYEELKAYHDQDVARAEAAIKLDEEVDSRFWNLTALLLKRLMESEIRGHGPEEAEEIAENTVILLLSLRDLERAADHAVNIGARVVYMITNRKDLI